MIALLDGKRAVHFPSMMTFCHPRHCFRTPASQSGDQLTALCKRHQRRWHDRSGDSGAAEINCSSMRAGNFEAPLSILSETRLCTQLNINRFNVRWTGGTYTQFLTQDVNADSREDLVEPDGRKLE